MFEFLTTDDVLEIHRDQIARTVSKKVALVHISVEKSITDGMAQKGLDHGVPKGREVNSGCSHAVDVRQGDAVDPFHCEHIAPGPLPVWLGQAKAMVILGVFAHFCIGRIAPEPAAPWLAQTTKLMV